MGALIPTSAKGGGSAFTTPISVTLTDPNETALDIPVGLAAQNVDVIDVTNTDNGENLLKLNPQGDVEIGAAGTTNNPGLTVFDGFIAMVRASVTHFVASKNGLLIGYASDPTAGFVSNSTMAIWLDATPGATKVMFRAKDSNGTDVTGSLALA